MKEQESARRHQRKKQQQTNKQNNNNNKPSTSGHCSMGRKLSVLIFISVYEIFFCVFKNLRMTISPIGKKRKRHSWLLITLAVLYWEQHSIMSLCFNFVATQFWKNLHVLCVCVLVCLCWSFTAQSTTRSCRAGQLIVALFLGTLRPSKRLTSNKRGRPRQ